MKNGKVVWRGKKSVTLQFDTYKELCNFVKNKYGSHRICGGKSFICRYDTCARSLYPRKVALNGVKVWWLDVVRLEGASNLVKAMARVKEIVRLYTECEHNYIGSGHETFGRYVVEYSDPRDCYTAGVELIDTADNQRVYSLAFNGMCGYSREFVNKRYLEFVTGVDNANI